MRRLFFVCLLLLAAFEANAANAGGNASISGIVFHDMDRDGLRDPGEPGLAGRAVTLSPAAGGPALAEVSDASGRYEFAAIANGDYNLTVSLDEQRTSCVNTVHVFNPYVQPFCQDYALPWLAMTASDTPVIVGGASVELNIGARPGDVAVLGGIALLEDRRAPAGTLVEGLYEGQECGSGMTTDATTGLNFAFAFLGDGERLGCPRSGDLVRFRVGGLMAPEVRFFQAFSDTTDGGLQTQPLTAIRQHSWLWAERRVSEPPPPGTALEALVEGTVCGSVPVEYVDGEAGFSRLLVASDELVDGCGRDDVPISFRTQHLDGAVTLAWEVDLREMEPRLFGDVTCNYGASAIDALLLLQAVAGLRSGFPCREGADVSGNGATDATDAALVLQFSAELIERLPA